MKVYAINWVMGSYIDSHIKKIFAQNDLVALAGFVFPKALVPRVNGIPVYTVENAPIDFNAVYVDFSNYQVLPDGVHSWLESHRLKSYNINGWLRALAQPDQSIFLDGVELAALASVRISPRSLSRIEYLSGDALRRSISAYQELNFRALHDNSCEPYEGYLNRNLKAIAEATPDGHIHVNIDSDDYFEYELSRSVFSMKEFASLKINLNRTQVYDVRGRSSDSARTRILITQSSGLGRIGATGACDANVVVMRLTRGLLDLDSAVTWISERYSPAKIRFDQISSNFKDSFLVCSA